MNMNNNQFLMVAWAAKAAHYEGSEIETNFSYEKGQDIFKALNLPENFKLTNSNGYLGVSFSPYPILEPEWHGIEGVSGAFSTK